MKFLFLASALCILSLLSPTTARKKPNANIKQLLKANHNFTLDLYKHISQEEGNVFFSPFSIHAVLSLAFQGAEGSTAEKFAKTLKIPLAKNAADGYSLILNRLNSVKNVTLLLANKIFLMDGKSVKHDFKTVAEKQFFSQIEQVNFSKNVQAAEAINKWVQEQTKNKINEIVSEEDLNDLTRFVTLNAVYFKGEWAQKFRKVLTKESNFYLSQSNSVQVKMMHNTLRLAYKNSAELDCQIVQLPYLNRDIKMVIILPNKVNGIKDLEEKLATTPFSSIFKGMHQREIKLQLPRFKIKHTLNNLKDILTKLGLGEIFDVNKANFNGIMEEAIFVKKAVQKAFIEVNEAGSEASGVTAVTGSFLHSARLPDPPKPFIVDHPFMFFITEKNDNVLFAGRVSNPVENNK